MNKNTDKCTLVIGASENPERYSNMAIRLLKSYGYPVLALGKKNGTVEGVSIETESNCFKNSQIDTISLYINPNHQVEYYDTILALKPKRVLFNPGTENPDLSDKLDEADIEWEEACTLILLRSGQF